MARERRKPAANDRRRPPKKKVSILNTEQVTWVDYKDVALLRRFMSERAKIRARRVTGNTTQQQRSVARAIRIAREMALLPYSVRQVTQRRGSRRDREREPRDVDTSMPTPTTPPPFEGAAPDEGVTAEVFEGAELGATEATAAGTEAE
jgi:small subunit ribosomal protein S18